MTLFKSVLLFPLVLPFLLLSMGANAADKSDEILRHSVVEATKKLLQDKHDGKCIVPQGKDDLHYMCTGAMLPGNLTKLEVSSCAVMLEIKCPDEKAQILASVKSYWLRTPKPNKVEPIRDVVSIESIEFKPN